MNGLNWICGLVVAGAAFVAVPEAKANTQRNCAVDSVGVIDGRMHIKCASIPGIGHTQAIYYFAMNLSEGPAKVQSVTEGEEGYRIEPGRTAVLPLRRLRRHLPLAGED